MKILIVCSANSGTISPFIKEQANSLQALGEDIDFFLIQQKGLLGYVRERKGLLSKISEFNPQLIHAHYGLSGLLANLQRSIPVITTYHGCDINKPSLRVFSVISILLSKFNIFVSKKQVTFVKFFLGDYDVIPCGVDYSVFYPIPKDEARIKLGFDLEKKIILFSSTFDRFEKNATLALEAIKLLPYVELIELKGYTRDEVCLLMNACDVGLLTSIREGSPMFIKELLACNRPIISTNVGDVEELIKDIAGCYIVPFDEEETAKALASAFLHETIQVPEIVLNKNDNQLIAKQIIEVYKSVLSKNVISNNE